MSPIKPLEIKNLLAPTPKNAPKYSTSVKNLKGEDETLADPKATRALVALMNQHAVIGGAACHWGGPAAFAEMMASVHAIMFREDNWFNQYNFVNDAGHAENGIYALRANYGFDNMSLEDLRKFRSIESKLTGHGESHLNPEGVFVSNGPLGSGVPQAQGLAVGDKLSGNERVTICTLSDGGAMEGEARESFAAIPGMAANGKVNPFVLLISDNNTKLSGRISQDSFDMGPSFQTLAGLGWDLTTIEKGHDLQTVHTEIEKAIDKAKANPSKPVAVVFKTIKGYGVKATEEAPSGGHGYPLKAYDSRLIEFIQEIYGDNTPEEFINWAKGILDGKPEAKAKETPAVTVEKVQPGFARATIAAAKKGLPVISVCADLQGSTGIAAFQKEFPEHTIDVGVAESNMISTAVGLSKQGYIPIVDTFSQFGITKGNLPLIMSTLSQGPVIGLFSHTGFQDAADGASHQATTYFSATASIPYTRLVSCSCSLEAEKYMEYTLQEFADKRAKGESPETTLFFLGRENFPAYYKEGLSYEWGKAQVLREGDAATIVATGPMVKKALTAADKLAEEGVKVSVINSPFINQPDSETIANELKKTNNRLVTIEDHQLIAGMGSMLTHDLKLKGHEFSVRSLGNGGKYGQSAYKADELYAANNMDEMALVEAVKSF